MAIDCLERVVLVVEDLAAATDHFARLLGRSPSWTGRIGDGEVDTCHFRLSSTTLELTTWVRPGAIGKALQGWHVRHGDGIFGLCFGTGDAAATARELRGRGLPASDPMESGAAFPPEGPDPSWITVATPPSATRQLLLLVLEPSAACRALPEAPLGVSQAAAVQALDHVVVLSPALDASRRLYEDQLALRLALDRRFPERGLRILFFRVGGVTLEVVGREGEAEQAHERDRFGGLAWRVDDPDAVRARLLSQGFDASEVRAGFKPGTRVFDLRGDTCGVPTLVIGPSDPHPSDPAGSGPA